MKTLIALILFAVAFKSQGQSPASNPNKKDSLQKAYADSIGKLITEKMLITPALIDSTFDRIQSLLNVKTYNKYAEAFNYFIGVMQQVWLDDNRKKKGGK